MEYYDFADWIEWPTEDIREYASEIAAANQLTAEQADHLGRQMTQKAGHWPILKERIGPLKMSLDSEELFCSLGNENAEVFEQNKRLNRPYVAPKFDYGEARCRTVGSRLTQRIVKDWIRKPAFFTKEERRAKRRMASRPFMHLLSDLRNQIDEAYWRANCYPINYGTWLLWGDHDKPYESLVWYGSELERVYYNARKQAELGNIEAAMFHAFKVGVLNAELGILMARGATFEKYQAVKMAQRDAAIARKTVPDETRRETYWKFRKAGNKKVEAGRLAGQELNLSEPSIRSAFPDGKYPPE
jgi:hypothetical protein